MLPEPHMPLKLRLQPCRLPVTHHCCWDSVSSEAFVLGSGEGGRLFLSSSSCCLRTSSNSNWRQTRSCSAEPQTLLLLRKEFLRNPDSSPASVFYPVHTGQAEGLTPSKTTLGSQELQLKPWTRGTDLSDDAGLRHGFVCSLGHWVSFLQELCSTQLCLGRKYLSVRVHTGLPVRVQTNTIETELQ